MVWLKVIEGCDMMCLCMPVMLCVDVDVYNQHVAKSALRVFLPIHIILP
jgi:hypothetical protein